MQSEWSFLIYCIHCGKPSPAGVTFCGHCGKPTSSGNAPGAVQPQYVAPTQQFETFPIPKPFKEPKPPRTPDPQAAKKLMFAGIGVGALIVIALAVWLISAWISNSSADVRALEEGLLSNCEGLSQAPAVSREELNETGNQTYLVEVDGESMAWVLSAETSSRFEFEVDSIYSASAIRAERLGCRLAFSASK